jgi:hypothetical protein
MEPAPGAVPDYDEACKTEKRLTQARPPYCHHALWLIWGLGQIMNRHLLECQELLKMKRQKVSRCHRKTLDYAANQVTLRSSFGIQARARSGTRSRCHPA